MVLKREKCHSTARFNCKLQRHMLAVHTDFQPWNCTFPGCNSKYYTKGNLQRHRRIHETCLKLRKPYPCTFGNCDYRAGERSVLANHERAKHTPGRVKTFQCSLCPSAFYDRKHLRQHIQSHVKEKRFKCKCCKFETHLRASLSLHVNAKHEKTSFLHCPFPGCDFRTAYPSCLRQHRRIHNPKEQRSPRTLIPCDYPECTHAASSVGNLKSHILALHSPSRTKDFKCPLCSKAFYGQNTLRRHIVGVHANQKQFRCSSCSFVTAYTVNLRRHFQRVHEGVIPEKKFKCDVCDYLGGSSRDLDRHRLTVRSEIRKFHCGDFDCDYETNYAGDFKRHVLIHEENPQKGFPFVCSFAACDFRRRTSKEITLHEDRHERKDLGLECKLCLNRSYPDPSSLRYHKYASHDKKPFKCSICSDCVSSKGSLKSHIQKLHSKSNSVDQGGISKIPRKGTSRSGDCDPRRSFQINGNNNSRNVVCSTGGFTDGDSALLRNPACRRSLIVLLNRIQIEKL